MWYKIITDQSLKLFDCSCYCTRAQVFSQVLWSMWMPSLLNHCGLRGKASVLPSHTDPPRHHFFYFFLKQKQCKCGYTFSKLFVHVGRSLWVVTGSLQYWCLSRASSYGICSGVFNLLLEGKMYNTCAECCFSVDLLWTKKHNGDCEHLLIWFLVYNILDIMGNLSCTFLS